MRSIAYYWKEGLRNIFKHGFMSVAAVVIMVVSLLLTGTVTLVAYNITNNITRLQAVQPDRSLDRRFAYHA